MILTPSPHYLKKTVTLLLGVILTFSASLLPASREISPVWAASVDDLNRQKALLEQQAKQAERDALKQKSVAERAAHMVTEVNEQIGDLQQNIEKTRQNQEAVRGEIAQKNQEVDTLTSKLGHTKEQLGKIIRKIRMAEVSMPDDMAFLANESLSKREEEQAYLTSLKKAAAQILERTNQEKLAVEKTRSDLEAKSRQLEGLLSQGEEQKRGLAAQRLVQAQLKENAEDAVVALEAKAEQARAEQNKLERRIAAELAAIIAARAKSIAINGGQSTGERVRRGTVIGHEGSTGNSTGPHVHLECRNGSVAVNCQPYINNGTLIYPISNFIISQHFGETANAALYGGAPHMGTDLAGPYGQPVFAPADGTVILKKLYGGYGYAWAEQLDDGLVVLIGHMTGW